MAAEVLKLIIGGQELEFVSKTDPTLSQENVPADAKSIGNVIEVINNKITTIEETIINTGQPEVYNENVFVRVDNKLDLYGFADATIGAQLLKGTDGKLSWVKPDSTTVEGLQTIVKGLESNVGILTENVYQLQSTTQTVQDNIVILENQVNTVSEKVSVLVGDDAGKSVRTIVTEELVNQLISEDAIESLDTLKEIADWIQQHPGSVTAMNTAIESLESQVSVIETVLASKVDAVEGSRLMTNEEGSKLANIEDNAQVNIIEIVNVGGIPLDIINKAVNVPVATADRYGVVKSTDTENGVTVNDDGTMQVNAVNVNNLTQTEGDMLVLNSGNSSI